MNRSLSDFPVLDYGRLTETLKQPKSDAELFQAIVNTPFEYKVETALMFLGIIVLLLVNKETGKIDRVALSSTDMAQSTTNVSVVPFEEIKIASDHPENIIAEAIRSAKTQDTTDWKFLFDPALTPDQARINQASAGIAYSAVYPLQARGGGALIFSYFQYQQDIGDAQRQFMEKYAALVDSVL